MEDSSQDLIKVAINNIYLVLKYMASGFVAVAVYAFLNSNIDLPLLKEEPTLIIFLAISIGLLTYAFHFAWLDKVFYGACAMKCWKPKIEKNVPLVFKQELYSRINPTNEKIIEKTDDFNIAKKDRRHLLFVLASQTYLRNVSEKKKVREIQDQMEKRLAFLNFLYCSGYQIFVLIVYFGIQKDVKNWSSISSAGICSFVKNHIATDINLLAVAVCGMGIFFSAYEFNYRICKREMWAVHKFPQEYSLEETKLDLPTQNISLTIN